MSQNERIFAIGDVHGCLTELERLLAKLSLKEQDQVILLGDLVNRGPDSSGVIRLCRQLPHARFLLGNHELRLLNYRKNADPTILKPYDWDTIHRLKEEDWLFMGRMEPFIELPEHQILLIHGGLLPWLPWREQPVETLAQVQYVNPHTRQFGKRTDAPGGVCWQDLWQGPPFVFCGHTPRQRVYRREASLCLDTACVYGGHLTACELFSQQLVQVEAESNYAAED